MKCLASLYATKTDDLKVRTRASKSYARKMITHGDKPMPDLSDQLSPTHQLDASELVLSDPRTPTAVPRVLLLWLTFGLAGAVLFTIVYLIEGAIRPGYNAWQQAISALSLGPGGWIQQANFVVFGACTLGMAFAWRKVLKGGVYALVYPLIRGIEGLALIMVGFFSQDPAPGYPPGAVLTTPTLHGEIHWEGNWAEGSFLKQE
jgi:hypothetical protein